MTAAVPKIRDTGLDPIFESASGAVIEGHYRYLLWRRWTELGLDLNKLMVFVMLNPSVADAEANDPTIRKCIGFARRNEYAGIIVCNMFAYRATDPRELGRVDSPVGDKNVAYLVALIEWISKHGPKGQGIWAAWGRQTGPVRRAVDDMADAMFEVAAGNNVPVFCLGKNQDGSPQHPLMLSYDRPVHTVFR